MMQLAKLVGDIATGERSDEQAKVSGDAAKRGVARTANLTPERRRAIAKKAARARWHK